MTAIRFADITAGPLLISTEKSIMYLYSLDVGFVRQLPQFEPDNYANNNTNKKTILSRKKHNADKNCSRRKLL